MSPADEWKRCSSCKAPIAYASTYYVCSVSTCTRKRTGFSFCSVECWETHVPMMRHRDAWAVEETAPTREAWQRELEGGDASASGEARERPGLDRARAAKEAPAVRRRVVTTRADETPEDAPQEILVIASRLKHYIREVHGLNTSEAVLDVLSDHLRRLANRAASRAKEAERKTVLDRDFDFLRG